MMNPIAFALIALGILLLVIGLLLVSKRKRTAGIAFSVLGLGLVAVPFVITFLLYR